MGQLTQEIRPVLHRHVPDEELHRFHIDQTRVAGALLFGRRLYEVMLYWETAEEQPSAPDYEREFARLWKGTPKSSCTACHMYLTYWT